jgi:hypothetical protein
MDLSKILPYVVPPAYVEGQTVSPDGIVRHLGHDVHIMLVHDLGGLCRNLLDDELDCSPQKAYEQAIENLVRLVQSKEIRLSLMGGPRKLPFVVAEGHWAAAACILLPRLYAIASEHLSSSEILASVPSRSSLVVFQLIDDAYNREMRRLMNKAERDETKLVSNSLFKVTADGVLPYGDTQPPPKPPSLFRRLFGS